MKFNWTVLAGGFAMVVTAFSLAVMEGAHVAQRDASPAMVSKLASAQ